MTSFTLLDLTETVVIQGFINKTELNYCSFLRVIFIELLFYCICLSYSGLCLLFLQEFPNFWDKKSTFDLSSVSI